jgi:hypothetical protein
VPSNFSWCAAKSSNVKEIMHKQNQYFHHFGLFLTFRCAAKLVFKISVPLAQKG